MERLVFFNIGWMSWYKGLDKQADKIVGGGKHVDLNGTGHEVCNFLACKDGYVYGHVESISGKIDRQIIVENMGGDKKDCSLTGITLVWTATHPTEGGRRIVGWYRNAKIFRMRQQFSKLPSRQHRADDLDSYRVLALAEDAHLLDVDLRELRMPRGKGWMGETPWWSPDDNSAEEVQKYLESVRELISSEQALTGDAQQKDIEDINKKDIPKTSKKALIDARLGQGRFRKDLLGRWGRKCAVTGCGVSEVLRASHIKAWRKCGDKERLDPNNGLLLAAHIDALFDKGLVSFSDNGTMLIANQISRKERETLGLPSSLKKKPIEGERSFLAYHRKEYGFKA